MINVLGANYQGKGSVVHAADMRVGETGVIIGDYKEGEPILRHFSGWVLLSDPSHVYSADSEQTKPNFDVRLTHFDIIVR